MLFSSHKLRLLFQVETLSGEAVQLVKLRHPQGAADVVGAWSRDSGLWDELPAVDRDRLTGKHLGDGEFWLVLTVDAPATPCGLHIN